MSQGREFPAQIAFVMGFGIAAIVVGVVGIAADLQPSRLTRIQEQKNAIAAGVAEYYLDDKFEKAFRYKTPAGIKLENDHNDRH